MAQNLISAVLPANDVTEILQNLAAIKAKMPFLSALQATDVSSLIKLGNAYRPFIDKVYQVVVTHPEILSPVFNKEEFLKDYELFKTMTPVLTQIEELAEGARKTQIALGSDLMSAGLEVYAVVKLNKDKVSGLSATHDELGIHFRKTKMKTDTSGK